MAKIKKEHVEKIRVAMQFVLNKYGETKASVLEKISKNERIKDVETGASWSVYWALNEELRREITQLYEPTDKVLDTAIKTAFRQLK